MMASQIPGLLQMQFGVGADGLDLSLGFTPGLRMVGRHPGGFIH